MRCAVEIESIAKDIYRYEVKKEPNDTGCCFNWIETNYKISQKALAIVSPNFHFVEKFSPKFYPFKYSNHSGDDYYSEYNAIKHDRVKNLCKASVGTLVRILGALYILNLYYANKIFNLGDDSYGKNIDEEYGSDIFKFFSVKYDKEDNIILEDGIAEIECIYRVRKEYEYSFKIGFVNNDNIFQFVNTIMFNKEFQDFARQSIWKSFEFSEFCRGFCNNVIKGDPEIYERDLKKHLNIKQISSIEAQIISEKYYAQLNKI